MSLKGKVKKYMENYLLSVLLPVFHGVYLEQPLNEPTLEDLALEIKTRLAENQKGESE